MDQRRTLAMEIHLESGWQLQSSTRVFQTGDRVSTPRARTEDWISHDLPATVLGALVDAGAHGDPFTGAAFLDLPGLGPRAQNFSNHPMPADSPFRVPWWYRKTFTVPAEAGPYLRLFLDGVNYRANVWLNGARIADDRAIAGAYRVHELDVTRAIDRAHPNVLALEVSPPEPQDLAISWVDWNPSPPDKNMGLWRDVRLVATGPVAVSSPFVRSKLDGLKRARLTIEGELVNLSDVPQTAAVVCDIEERRAVTHVDLGPGERRTFTLDAASHPELLIHAPRIWWPRGMGVPSLYRIDLQVLVGGMLSDTSTFRFGVREVYAEKTADGHTQFLVNGEPVLIRGGGWAPDLFLRRQPQRDVMQLEYVKDLNLNTIRFEGLIERNEFLDWCDRDGILVIAGWCCCDQWEKWDRWTDETVPIAVESLRSQIRRIRRHPSVISWLYGSDHAPPPAVEQAYLRVLEEEHWPNAHHSSASHRPAQHTGPSGMKMQGPYEWVPPSYWLEDGERGGAFGFASEICPGPAIPPVESLRRMLGPSRLWPIDDVWSLHAGGQEFHNVKVFTDALEARLGRVDDVETYAQLAQLMTYEAQRAMFEGYTRNRPRATGVIQWMLNNAWPSLIWHLWDWYLRPGGGYFGTKKACEPLHVMVSTDDRSVVVLNETARFASGVDVRVRVFTADGDVVFSYRDTVDVVPGGKRLVCTIPRHDGLDTPIRLVEVTAHRAGVLVSDGFYWLPRANDTLAHDRGDWRLTPVDTYADLSALRALPRAAVGIVAAREADAVSIELRNATDRLAFFLEARLIDLHGQDVLPALWSDNFVSLPPGERRVLRVAPLLPVGGHDLRVEVRGLNVPAVSVPVSLDAGTRRPSPAASSWPDPSTQSS